MREITLRLSDGQKKTFSEEELVAIVERDIQNQKAQKEKEATEYAPIPTEGKWFKVDPLAIDQNLFKEKRKNSVQERTRQIILQAFEKVKWYSEYARSFKTMMPPKKWASKTVKELKDMACKLGDHNANWVEQALEWAQRIHNGETWEDICNKQDTANWYRIVIWDNVRYVCLVGGSCKLRDMRPAVEVVFHNHYCDRDVISKSVPAVVSYDV